MTVIIHPEIPTMKGDPEHALEWEGPLPTRGDLLDISIFAGHPRYAEIEESFDNEYDKVYFIAWYWEAGKPIAHIHLYNK